MREMKPSSRKIKGNTEISPEASLIIIIIRKI